MSFSRMRNNVIIPVQRVENEAGVKIQVDKSI